ncbi:cytochrome P450 [Saccharopolyspora lacisalsi]|uniref:Cytochrome P450 n=1 Tax=Halosaccharopolyspora lacisalsi TaxID=1000566 RepID=A0A839DZG0_9PSEU|nr:cytochrome P450 [Halosaccharopolyspora lacisalsi]MBA8826089.1 cytochrome P450 [Halosaccharopolyspora lacisalsi]
MTTSIHDTAHEQAVVHLQQLMKPRGNPDPYREYDRIRQLAPVLKSPLPAALGGYVLSRHEDCAHLLRDRAFASIDPTHMDTVQPHWRTSRTAHHVHQAIGFRNPPDHTRLRAAMAPHFTPRHITELHSLIDETVDDLLDSLSAHTPSTDPVDLIEAAARPLPVAVMRTLFGLDSDTARELARLGHLTAPTLDLIRSPAQQQRMEHAGTQLLEAFRELIAARAGAQESSLLSSVIEACGGPDPANDEELVGNLLFLFTAGHETLVGFLGLAVRTLLQHPDQAELLRNRPDLAPSAVEELLRYDSSIQITVRMAQQPVHIGEHAIEPGTTVLGLLGAANRDPDRTPEPHVLDLTRASPSPLSFGGGAHYCLGSFLARTEAQALLPRLLQRFPHMSLARAPTYRSPGTTLRGIEHLPVHLHG